MEQQYCSSQIWKLQEQLLGVFRKWVNDSLDLSKDQLDQFRGIYPVSTIVMEAPAKAEEPKDTPVITRVRKNTVFIINVQS